MTLLFAEGFDDGLYNGSGKWDLYAQANQTWPVTGRYGGSALQMGTTSGVLEKLIPVPVSKVIVGCGFRFTALAVTTGYTGRMISTYADAAVLQISIRLAANGHIGLYRSTTLIASTVSPVFTGLNWAFVELSTTLHASTGRAIVRVNNQVVIDFTGNTINGATTVMNRWGVGFVGDIQQIDDLYVNSGDGPAPNNDFLGDVTVETLMPNGNGTFSQLLGSDGNSVDNFQLVDEKTFGGGADYTQGVAEGLTDTYAMENIPSGGNQVFGMMLTHFMAKSEAGSKFARRVIRSAGTNYPGVSKNLTASYVLYQEAVETDPATGVAWTKAGVDAMELGMEVRNS